MKKALVILLTLVFVTGGLFAQTFTWTGGIGTGLGLMKTDGEDKVDIGLFNRAAGSGISRADLTLNYTNDSASAGFRVHMRVQGNGNSWADGLIAPSGLGWMNFLDGMMQVEGGKFDGFYNNNYSQLDLISDGAQAHGSHGILVNFKPVTGIAIGVGAQNPIAWTDPVTESFTNVRPFIGFAFAQDIFAIRAQFYGEKDKTRFLASTNVTAIKEVPIGVGLDVQGLSNLSDEGLIFFNADFGLNFIDNLDLRVAGQVGINNAEGADNTMRAYFRAIYNMGSVAPRLDVNYVVARKINLGHMGWNGTHTSGPEWDNDLKYLSIAPSAEFRVTPTAWVEVAYLCHLDMSSEGAATWSDKNKGVNHGIGATFRVTF